MITPEPFLATITAICLLWGAVVDVKSRMASDLIWIVQILASLPFLIIWYMQTNIYLFRMLFWINIIMGIILGFAFYFAGGFGGADSFALIAVSISSPIFISRVAIQSILPPIFFFLVNLFIYFLIFVIAMLVYNLYSIRIFGPLFSETNGSFWAKMGILISGRRIAREKVKDMKFEDPAEQFNGIWQLHVPVFDNNLNAEDFEEREQEARDKAWEYIKSGNRTYLWSRPQPPALVFFFFAYIHLLIFGSPITYFIN